MAQTVPESAPDTEPKTGNRDFSSEQIFEKMREVLAVEFEILGDSVRPDAQLVDDLDLDSLDVISLLQELGDVIGVGLDEDDVRDCKTLADLADRISIRLAGES